MTEALGSPHPATVIAIGLKARLDDSPSLPATRRIFTNLLGGTLAHNCHIQPASAPGEELAFTAVVPDTAQSLSLIRRLLSIQDEFRGTHPDTAARFVVHHGVVFPSDKGYIGSALRSAHSRLTRLPHGVINAATTDFAAYTETWDFHPIVYHKQEAAHETLGLLGFSIEQPEPAPAESKALHDEALLHYLTSRLADHLGPFAEVLVDAAQRSSSTPRQLIEELASEIDDAKARQDFRKDAQDFLYSQPSE
jgi:hypothetical protein